VRFAKLQATGNDFVLIEAEEEHDWPPLARTMCNRHLGIGADGLIVLLPSMIGDLRMRLFNPDGSEAEACGNGLRCLARYAVESQLIEGGEMSVETQGGMRRVYVQGELLQVDMGAPILKPGEIPVNVEDNLDIILACPLTVGDTKLSLTLLSMGNPHAVCFSEEPVARFPLSVIGPEVEKHQVFPNRVNFEVANVLGPQRIMARVWERGAGETLSCGTGACAVMVAAHLHQSVANEVDVILPGGLLTVSWDGTGEVKLRGPAELLFKGEWAAKNMDNL
jgi:diaminopimelate epimerase